MDDDVLKEERRSGRKVGGLFVAISVALFVILALVRTPPEGILYGATCFMGAIACYMLIAGLYLLVAGGGGGKYCGRCGKEVASSSRAGQKCPNCGALWWDERTVYH
jgi:hypothetical protein